ncbi:helix-turn-helix domain-containing protein [Sphingobacterium lactis]|uniref:AraC-type DNA-binding protein n=1 Tax=Sphingobacterium lactis TaxID=797291 RepID=A0A1H5XSR5_9SPHI|nr:helix-turn-helix domain-containing protein [Sphingobacterium lactis]SEG14702.1 AraC-type DNA-binding protein [Sphingobacterium lactis]
MNHLIDLLSIQTPEHLRTGHEYQTRFDCGSFEVNVFETFQSSTKVRISYAGLSISSMIRGYKTVFNKQGNTFKFLPGTSLILPEGETIYADFPEADPNNPVQCATILIPKESMEQQLDYLNEHYPEQRKWALDYDNFHFNNNSALVRAFNELLQVAIQEEPNIPLADLLLKSFLIRLIDAQIQHVQENKTLQMNSQLLVIKKYIRENIGQTLNTEVLMRIGNCSKSTLHRLFETYCGKTPGSYILQERMLNARNLLLRADSNVSDVAYKTGFSSLSYFVKQFKAFHNCTPGDFVRKFGK